MIKRRQSYLNIIPVRVQRPTGTVNTFALLDDESKVDDNVAKCIGVTGPTGALKIESINDMKALETSSRRGTI